MMKINETRGVGGVHSYQRNMETHRQEQQKTRRKDEVSISSEAMEMLHAQGRAADAERAHKIQSLKEQVAAGTYQVSADKLAEKLLPYFKQFPDQ